MRTDRARVHASDIAMAVLVSVAALAMSPAYYELITDISAESGPLSALLLQLVVPFIFISVVISIGISARRRV